MDANDSHLELISASQLVSEENSMIDCNVAPICKLHPDVLLQIFQLNVNMDHDLWQKNNEDMKRETTRAIITTRNSSQVNSFWRNLVINAPILWANLIDIDYLEASGEWWRGEVIRRTNDSPLYIKGRIFIPPLDKLEPWVADFFEQNWSRIRKVDLRVLSGIGHTSWFPHLLCLDHKEAEIFRRYYLPFLSLSAPTLESFRLQLPYLWDPLETGLMLFENYAPQLRFFDINNVWFSPQCDWLSQLRRLHIHEFHAQTFESGDILCQALSQMPNLQSLSLSNAIINPSISVYQGYIHLPRLRYLCIRAVRREDRFETNSNNNSETATCWELLARIIPQTGCLFKLHISPAGKVDSATLLRLAKNYFQVHEPNIVDILYSEVCFELADNRAATGLGQTMDPSLPLFSLSTSSQFFSTPALHLMVYQAFDAFLGLSFARVTDLRLLLGPFKNSLLSSIQWRELLAAFTSVEALTTTSGTLDFIHSLDQTIKMPTLFPMLKVLKTDTKPFKSYFDSSAELCPSPIKLFLNLRKEGGAPIEIFEYHSSLPKSTMSNRGMMLLHNLSCLDTIVGMKVVWKTEMIGDGEYVCGSGNPNELDFAQKSRFAQEANQDSS